jgi:hypothetical protein
VGRRVPCVAARTAAGANEEKQLRGLAESRDTRCRRTGSEPVREFFRRLNSVGVLYHRETENLRDPPSAPLNTETYRLEYAKTIGRLSVDFSSPFTAVSSVAETLRFGVGTVRALAPAVRTTGTQTKERHTR